MQPFAFNTKYDQSILLGRKAKNLQMLLAGVRAVPESSLYFHTHRFLLQHHFLSPEPPNDFAYWATEVLNDDPLGEKLSSVDILQYASLEDLRTFFITVLDESLQHADRLPDCPRGEEFHFMACRTFVLPTPYAADNLEAFSLILEHISISALYYHIFDARLRLGRGDNDFSRWFADLGHEELAAKMRMLDPYTQTLEGLRSHIITMVRDYDAH